MYESSCDVLRVSSWVECGVEVEVLGRAGGCVGGRVVNHGLEFQGHQEAWVVSRVVSCRVEFPVTKELLEGGIFLARTPGLLMMRTGYSSLGHSGPGGLRILSHGYSLIEILVESRGVAPQVEKERRK